MKQEIIQHIVSIMYAIAYARKKVGKPNFSEKDLEYILRLVNAINALGEFDTRLGDELLSEVKIPSFVKDFIYPSKVSLSSDWAAKDLVIRPAKDSSFVYNYGQISNIAYKISGTFKKDKPDLISVGDLRKAVMLSDVNISINGRVKHQDQWCIPVPVDPSLAPLLGDTSEGYNWSNMDETVMVDNYLERSFSFVN